MNILIEPGFKNYLDVFYAGTIFRSLTYLVPVFIAYVLFLKIFSNRLKTRRISSQSPSSAQMWFEIRHSLQTMMIWAGISILHVYLTFKGWTQVYLNISDYSLGYYIFTIFLVICIHDTYFYWTHRMMHHPKLFKYFHSVHHRSKNPTPWAIFSFQSSEAVVQFAITFILVFAFPCHYSVHLIWTAWLFAFNIMGHLGYELLPRNFATGRLTKWLSTATHHGMHHKFVNNNFGLYFTFWDRIMGTENPDYIATATATTTKPGNGNLTEDLPKTTSQL